MFPDFRIQQRDALLEIIRTITQELDLNRVLEKILRTSVELLDGQAGIIALPGGDAAPWRIAVSVGVAPAFLLSLEPILRDLTGQEVADSFILPEVDRRLQHLTRTVSLGMLYSLGLPMVARGKVVGVVYIFRTGRVQFGENERVLLQAFTDHAAVAVSNARLFEQVHEEKQRLDAILQSSAEGIAILGPDNRIQKFNRAMAVLTGIPSGSGARRPARRDPPLFHNRNRADAHPGRGRRVAAGGSGYVLSPGQPSPQNRQPAQRRSHLRGGDRAGPHAA